MAAVVLLAVAVVLALCAGGLRVTRGLGVVVGAVLLIPATLSVPNPVTPDLTVTRLVIVAFTAGLVWRTATGRLPSSIWRPGAVHAVALLYVAVTLVTGVGLAVSEVDPFTALSGWLDVVDQMLVLVAGIAAFRAIDSAGYALKLLAGGVLAMAFVGIGEHITGGSWAQQWFHGIRSQAGSLEARNLTERSGEVRVRGAAQFALEYGWLCALLVPALIGAALSAWRRSWLLAPAAVVVLSAVLWSVTRSAIPALAGGVLLMAILVRDRRFVAVAGIAAVVTATAVIANPRLTGSLSESVDPGSVEVRGQRLPTLLQLVVDHKVSGLGFGGLRALGLPTTDFGWLRIYGEAGVLGLVTLVVLFTTVLAYTARGLLSRSLPTRAAAAAAMSALILAIAAGFAYDTFTIMMTGRVIWLLAACGLVAAERGRVPQVITAAQWRARLRSACLAGAGCLAAGVLAFLAWPRTASVQARFELFPPAVDIGNYDTVDSGKVLLHTVCDASQQMQSDTFSVQCRSTERAAGEGVLRISGATVTAVTNGLARVVAGEQSLLSDFHVVAQTQPRRGVPAPIADAPLALALLGIAAGLLVPPGKTLRKAPSPVPPAGALQGAVL